MPKYISKYDLLNAINTNVAEAPGERCSQLLEAILNAPTADVVEVVRCKDCSFYKYGDCWNKQWEDCEGNMPTVKETDFCSYGERKGQ